MVPLSDFCITVMLALYNEFGSVPFSYFLQEFGKGRHSFFKCLVELSLKPSCPEFLFVGRFLTTVQFPY